MESYLKGKDKERKLRKNVPSPLLVEDQTRVAILENIDHSESQEELQTLFI